MAIATYQKDPDALLDYTIDWTRWLPSGDTIASATWTVPSPMVLERDVTDSRKSTVWVRGGVAGETYAVACLVTTAAGRVDERSISIQVVER